MKKILLAFASLVLLTSCANKSMTRYEALEPALKKNGYEGAIQEVKKNKDKLYGSNTEFLYYMDLGVLEHYAGNFDASSKSLDAAAKIYDDLYTRSVTNEAASILTNDNVRPYRARPFELLMLYQFKIMNYLAKGDIDGAAVEVRKSQIAMTELYQKDNKKVNDNGFLRYLGAMVYELDGKEDDAAIDYYKTVQAYDESKHPLPKEVWGFVCDRLRAYDREDDLKNFKRAPVIYKRAENTREENQEIVIVAYGGHSPILGELYAQGTYINGGALNLSYKNPQTNKMSSFTMIAPIMPDATNGETFHISLSLPQKKVLKNRVNGFIVNMDGERWQMESMLDTDLELTQNLDDDWSATIGRTALRVAIRTFAAQKAKAAMKTDNAVLNLFTSLGTDIAQSQLEQADLRIGLFYPQNIYMTRLPVKSGKHKLSVNVQGKYGQIAQTIDFGTVNVKPNQKLFLFVPAID